MVTAEGVVLGIVYRNDENGFTVLEMEQQEESFIAVGCVPHVREGEQLRVIGDWVYHKDYGKQLKLSSCEVLPPSTLAGLERYLGSGLIRGVGPVTARNIVKTFCMEALDVLQYAPHRLQEVAGIGVSKAQMIGESFQEQRNMREVMLFLQTYEVSPHYAVKIYKIYGPGAVARISKNPYDLIENVPGIGFKTADKLASKLGIETFDAFRLHAGVKYVLQEALQTGHTYLPMQKLLIEAQKTLQVDEPNIQNAISALAICHEIVLHPWSTGVAVYLSLYDQCEQEVARRIHLLKDVASRIYKDEDIEAEISIAAKMQGIVFDDVQQTAIQMAMKKGMMVLTGGPGTGKTTTLHAILMLFEKAGLKVELAAPTGRAAKRMSEATGRDARTIHRLLEYSRGASGDGSFQRNEERPIKADAIIIDETSMIDIFLLSRLLRAVGSGTRVVWVGDADQLPSVGPGNVLRDMIKSGVVPVIQLTQIFRQAEKSMIVVNAHRINAGNDPIIRSQDTDFFLENKTAAQDIENSVVALCKSRIPHHFGYTSADIQVLSPMKKGLGGVFALNDALQKALNPLSSRKMEKQFGDTLFREGDRVMQMKNNYDLKWQTNMQSGEGVFNGDVGIICSIDHEDQMVTVCFDNDRKVMYDFSQMDEIDRAYAVTVHKSQGSEFEVVVLSLPLYSSQLCTRNLLYTAITRAKSLVVIVGATETLHKMVQNKKEVGRYSGLERRLVEWGSKRR